MIFVGVIIIVGVLVFSAFAAYSVHRRSVLVDRKKESLQKRRNHIHEQDQLLTESLTEALLAGKRLVDLVPPLTKQRADLLREKGRLAGAWTAADVDEVLNDDLHVVVGRINRKLAFTLSLLGIVVFVITIVSAATLYAFLESTPGLNSIAIPLDSPIDAAEPYDPFAIDSIDTNEEDQT